MIILILDELRGSGDLRKEFSLKVNARHISQLGRELVTDYVTALVELVKNSYDADSEGVKIIFEGIKKGNGKIIIIDTGTGMSVSDVESKWAVIGTNNKIRKTHSPKGRKYAGKKGIGRFAVERLAEKTTIYSFHEYEEQFKFSLNWNRYEGINIPGILQRIKVMKNNPNDWESKKYILSHLDYFISNPKINDDDKKIVLDFCEDDLFLTNKIDSSIKKIEEIFVPLLEKYFEEEDRIEEVKHYIDGLLVEERKNVLDMLRAFYQELKLKKSKETGLVIILENLRDDWKRKDIIKVKKELRLLVEPSFLSKDPFHPVLVANEFDIPADYIVNEIIDLYYSKLDAKLLDNGRKIEINYSDKSNQNKLESFQMDPPLLSGFIEMELFYFIRDSENLTKEGYNLKYAREVLDEFCGIKIYRDGFHVKPYGDSGNDWLLLDQTKVRDPHSYLIGNNQVIGIIKISDSENPLLIDASNREGILENEAFESVRKFAIFCTDYISNVRYEEYKRSQLETQIEEMERKKKEDDERKKLEEARREKRLKEELEKEEREFSEIIEKAKNDNPEYVNQVVNQFNKYKKQSIINYEFHKEQLEQERKNNELNYSKTKSIFEGQIDNKDRELSLYKNLASLGMLTGSFGHETADIINRISVDLSYVKKWILHIIEKNDDIKEAYNKIEDDFKRMQAFSKLIVNFVKKSKRENLEHINFKEVIQTIVDLYFTLIRSQNIDLDLQLQETVSESKMLRIDIESIVINMLTNSFEALKTTKNKIIKITCAEYDEYYQLIFEDNGNGVKDGYNEVIFSPFQTTKEDGVGLGLCIVKDIVNKYKGTIDVVNSTVHGGAIFKIKFMKEE